MESSNKQATKQRNVAVLLPLENHSKNLFEVLRLGSGELRSADPRSSVTPLAAIRINLCFEALTPEWPNGLSGRFSRDGARSPNPPNRRDTASDGKTGGKIERKPDPEGLPGGYLLASKCYSVVRPRSPIKWTITTRKGEIPTSGPSALGTSFRPGYSSQDSGFNRPVIAKKICSNLKDA
jgi:hypothetical protein